MKVELLINQDAPCPFLAEITPRFEAALTALSAEIPEGVSEVSLLFTDDSKIKALNRDYRGKDSATDVLSFPQLEGPETPLTSLGDIVISVETALRDTAELDVSPQAHTLWLFVHGLLHLLGYDHEGVSESEAQRMYDRERTIIAIVGDLS